MTKKLSNAEMLEVVHQHGAFEAAIDLDGSMSQLTPDISWIQHNMGLRIDGTAGVREWYTRLLPALIPLVSDIVEKNVWFGEDRVILDTEFSLRLPDGSVRREPGFYVYQLRGDMICGERTFHSDKYSPLYSDVLGDLEGIPGLSRV